MTKPSKGYYSLIQYCPDLGRLEAANIGVLLFCPERHFLKALMSPNNRRIIRFFGSEAHDWIRINEFKKGLRERIAREGAEIASLDQLQRFIDQRANLLQITPPRPMRVTEPDQDLAELAKEFLGETAHRSSSKSLRRYLSSKLSAPGLERKIRENIKVTVPVFKKEIEIPFGFQNGRFNIINPVPFEAANPEQSVLTACKYAVEGRSLYENSDPKLGKLQLFVVGKFRPTDHEAQSQVERVLADSNVRLYRMSQLPQLIEEIRKTGKDIAE
jgi:hypothetical protein